MDSAKVNDWLQIVGMFGLLGGLIFVGLQLRLDRQDAVTQAAYSSTEVRIHWAELVNDNADVWVKGSAGEPLSATETARFNALAHAHELYHYQAWRRAGQISRQPPELWVLMAAAEFHRHPGLLQWWRTRQSHTEAIRQRLGRPPSAWVTAVEEELGRLEREALAN